METEKENIACVWDESAEFVDEGCVVGCWASGGKEGVDADEVEGWRFVDCFHLKMLALL